MAILRRTEKAKMRAMCGVKIIKKEPRTSEFAGFKGYFEWTSQGKWSVTVWACFEKR